MSGPRERDRPRRLETRAIAAAAVLVVALAIGPFLAAAATVRHSGTIVAMDPRGRTLTLAEVGPWPVQGGKTRLVSTVIDLTPQTRYAVFLRVDAPGRFAGDFIEVPLELSDFDVGFFVTVECELRGGRLVATSVSAMDTSAPALEP
ncbi:MAG: hypothetical protein HYR86_12850 [Candidatus Rokubacteria bacterium]|nr:hypothetical protein [Candidatus Rokubacteria bacterium]